MAKHNSALKYSQSSVDLAQENVDLDPQAVLKVAYALGVPDVSFTSEQATSIMKNAFHNYPEVAAELVKQLASEHNDLHFNAYEVAMKGIRELAKFNPEVPMLSEGSTNDFFSKVARLKGPGSERVKFDVAKLLTENIAAAEQTEFAEPDAIEYSRKLGAIIQRARRSGASKTWRLFRILATKTQRTQSIF